MPRDGLGTWPFSTETVPAIVESGLEVGFRLIDTAENYENETGVGKAIRNSNIDRGEIFVSSKFNRLWHSRSGVREAAQRSLDRLGLDYLDLFMVHWPNPQSSRTLDTWQGLIDLVDQGIIRAAGVSNFTLSHLRLLSRHRFPLPQVNQVQLNVGVPRLPLRKWCGQRSIVVQSWRPLGDRQSLTGHPDLAYLAQKYSCSPGQVALAWQFSSNLTCVTRSSSRKRQKENFNAQFIEIETDDLSMLASIQGASQSLLSCSKYGH